MSKNALGINPWTHIWTHPRETISKIVNFNPKYRFVFLSFLYGFPMLLHMAQNVSFGDNYGLLGIVLGALILGTFAGMLAMTIASALLLWTGKWIGGKGSFYEIRAAVSWANVPNILSIIIWAGLIYFFRNQLFMGSFDQANFTGRESYILTGAVFIEAVLAIWSFIILVKSLGQVQGFSAWKGVLNILIPFFMMAILIWVISWIVLVSLGMV